MKCINLVITAIILAFLFTTGVSAVRAVKFAHEQSNLVSEVQLLKKTRDKINAEWTQLLLEQQYLADDRIVEHIVKTKLNLHLPPAKQVVYLK